MQLVSLLLGSGVSAVSSQGSDAARHSQGAGRLAVRQVLKCVLDSMLVKPALYIMLLCLWRFLVWPSVVNASLEVCAAAQ